MTTALGWGMFFYGMTAVFIGAVMVYVPLKMVLPKMLCIIIPTVPVSEG